MTASVSTTAGLVPYPVRAQPHRVALALLALLGFVGVQAAPATADRKVDGFDCTILAARQIEVRSPVSGLLEAVPYTRGQIVKKGSVVAVLESSVERASLAVARQKAEMNSPIESGRARVDLSGKKYERRRDLAADKALSLQERDDAELEKRLADAELKQAHENRALAALERQQALEQLNRRTLRSPIDGLVVDQYVQVGELVDPSDPKRAIVKLVQYDPLRIEVILPVSMFGQVKVGDTADVMPEKPIGGSFATTVKLVDRVIDPSSGTFGVRLELPNPKLAVPPGIGCRISFRTGRP